MTARFATNVAILAASTVLACCSLALRPAVGGWIGLGDGALVLLATAWGFATRGRGTTQRLLDGAVVLLGAWTVVASRVFPADGAMRWLMFSAAAAAFGVALCGLVAHEVVMELSLRRAARREEIAEEIVERVPPIRVAG